MFSWILFRLFKCTGGSARQEESSALLQSLIFLVDGLAPATVTRAVFFGVGFLIGHVGEQYADPTVFDGGKKRVAVILSHLVWKQKVLQFGEVALALMEADKDPMAVAVLTEMLRDQELVKRATTWQGVHAGEADPAGTDMHKIAVEYSKVHADRQDPTSVMFPTYFSTEMTRLIPVFSLIAGRLIETRSVAALSATVLAPPLSFILGSNPQPLTELHSLLHYYYEAEGLDADVKRCLVAAFALSRPGIFGSEGNLSEAAHALTPAFLAYVKTGEGSVLKTQSYVRSLLDRVASVIPTEVREPVPSSPLHAPLQPFREFTSAPALSVVAALVELLASPLDAEGLVALMLKDLRPEVMMAKASLLSRLPLEFQYPVFHAWIDTLKRRPEEDASEFALWNAGSDSSLLQFAHAFFLGVSALSLELIPEFLRSIRPAVSISQIHVLCKMIGPTLYRMSRTGSLGMDVALELLACLVDVFEAESTAPVLDARDQVYLESVVDFVAHAVHVFGGVSPSTDLTVWEQYCGLHSRLPVWLGSRLRPSEPGPSSERQ